MTPFESLSLVISCIAALLSFIAWNGQRALHKKSNELQEATAELARKQLELIKDSERKSQVAELGMNLSHLHGSARVEIWNIGTTDAFDVEISLKNGEIGSSFLIPSKIATKLPIKRLRRNEHIGLIAAITLDTPVSQDFVLSWRNPDGSLSTDQFTLRL